MDKRIEILRGIHPGKVIGRELQKRRMTQKAFAASIGELPQALNAVITGRRNLTTELSLKIEKALNYGEGFLLTLQAYYDIATFKQGRSESKAKAPNIRKILFWDSEFDKIDWQKYKNAVIERVLERGSQTEKEEIAHFYNIPVADLDKYRISKNNYRIKALTRK